MTPALLVQPWLPANCSTSSRYLLRTKPEHPSVAMLATDVFVFERSEGICAIRRGASERWQGGAGPGCDRDGAPEERNLKAQGASPGAAAPYPALKGRNLAGDADCMGESRSVPALTGRGSLRTDAQGNALGYRLPPLRGSICDLAAWWRCLSKHSLRCPIHGRLSCPYRLFHAPL